MEKTNLRAVDEGITGVLLGVGEVVARHFAYGMSKVTRRDFCIRILHIGLSDISCITFFDEKTNTELTYATRLNMPHTHKVSSRKYQRSINHFGLGVDSRICEMLEKWRFWHDEITHMGTRGVGIMEG